LKAIGQQVPETALGPPCPSEIPIALPIADESATGKGMAWQPANISKEITSCQGESGNNGNDSVISGSVAARP
jgi:hypothetical protein